MTILEKLLNNSKIVALAQKELGLTAEEINKTLYGNITVKAAKATIDEMDDTDVLFLLRRIVDLLIPLEDEYVREADPNPFFEAMAALTDAELGLLVQHISKRPQFKSRKVKIKETVIEHPL